MKKRNHRMLLLGSLAVAVTLSISACGNKTSNLQKDHKATSASEETSVSNVSTVADNVKAGTDEIPMLTLPEGITGMKAETKPFKELRDLIIEDMVVPEDYYETTHYFYNYIDLNDDGKNEIFAMVTGPYTSGTGGSSALLLSENGGKLHITQEFTLVNEPIIVSDTLDNGYHDLIIPYYSDNKTQYSVLKYNHQAYPNVPDGEIIDHLDGVKGKAIIANDRINEVQTGIMGLSLLDK
ncbi:hypothetical protein [Lacrimispora algidixylanolytica]|uniref:Lipoprotein n=1 Tax=Lacrimispora algidixylanolytica TaxID=94868 RepID=A0A419T793_9FIRM|nr:hypothetical protein [Lacrimispora algidixylanolytica]RKD33341.1 hypothetical protein BET01_15075 [Lacrimispora algidixylanolytica]